MTKSKGIGRGKHPKKYTLAEFERLGRLRCTSAEIAAYYGVDERTVGRWIHDDPRLAQAKKAGEAARAISLRRLQWKAAERGSIPMLIFLGKNYLGQADVVEKVHSGEVGIRYRASIGADGSARCEVIEGEVVEARALPAADGSLAFEDASGRAIAVEVGGRVGEEIRVSLGARHGEGKEGG